MENLILAAGQTVEPWNLLVGQEQETGFVWPFFGADSEGVRGLGLDLAEYFHYAYTNFGPWWDSVLEDFRRADVKTYSFGGRMDIAGKGTYPLRIYPLCYDDDHHDADLYNLSIDDSNYFTQKVHWDLNKRLTLKLEEGGRCQLPFDGANTNAFQLLYLPGDGSTGLKSPGVLDFTIGASVDYDMDLYTWDWYGNCEFQEYRRGQESDARGWDERDISGRLKEISTLSPRYPGNACAINMYFWATDKIRDCGRDCDTDRDYTVYIWSGGQQFILTLLKRLGNAIDQWIGLSLIIFAISFQNAWETDQFFVIIGIAHFLLEIIADYTNAFTLRFFSNMTSLIMFAANFPLWLMYSWEILMYWFEKRESPIGSDEQQELICDFMLTSAFVLEQFLHPMEYSYSLVILIGIGAWHYLRREALAGRFTKNLLGFLQVFVPFCIYLYVLADVF